MWRPNPKHQYPAILRRLEPDGDKRDDYGHPVTIPQDFILEAEVYPYSNPVNLQAMGVAGEETRQLIFSGPLPRFDDLILMDGKEWSMKSISPYNPTQVVVIDTGRSIENA